VCPKALNGLKKLGTGGIGFSDPDGIPYASGALKSGLLIDPQLVLTQAEFAQKGLKAVPEVLGGVMLQLKASDGSQMQAYVDLEDGEYKLFQLIYDLDPNNFWNKQTQNCLMDAN
jgi:hypothetical protein